MVESDSVLRLSLVAVDRGLPAAMPPLASLERRVPGAVVVSGDADRRALEQRVEGLTAEKLMDDLVARSAAGQMLDHHRWLWRATGLLMLEPELCRDLIPIFEDGSATGETRALILDLLASTGHGVAQDVMRTLLASAAARRSPHYPLLVQRFSMVTAPDAETMEFLRAEFVAGEPGSDGRYGLAHALGAVAGQRQHLDDAAGAWRASEPLRSGLAQTKSPVERAVFLRALGNAGLPGDVPALAQHATDAQPAVRAAVASALRTSVADGAQGTLLTLVADGDASVQGAALTALMEHPLAGVTMERLAGVVTSGVVQPPSYGPLVVLVAQQDGDGTAARRIYSYLLARPSLPVALRSQIQSSLDALPAST